MNKMQDKEVIPAKTKNQPKNRKQLSPSDPDNFITDPGDISKIIDNGMSFFNMPKVTCDEELESRIIQYFSMCSEKDAKPSVSGMAFAIGYERGAFYDWTSGRRHGFSPRTADIVKKAMSFMEMITVQLSQDGKVNPAIGIFMLKNYYGFKDVNEVTLSQGVREQSVEAIEAKYDEIPDEI